MTIKKHAIGFSLVEMSIVLVIIGILAFFSVKFVSNIGRQALNEQFKNDLQRADQAIIGFIYANNRLPCPDINKNGFEECGIANITGNLPIKTLGIESSLQKKQGGQIRYGVFRKANANLAIDNDLAQLKDRFEPLLPDSAASNQSNGLDLCLALKTASLTAPDNMQLNIGSSSINVAYAIADSGALDANNDSVLFDGSNGSGVKFEKPNKPHINNYDDNVLAIGFNELSGRLNCAKVLAETNGGARASFAAYDMWRISTVYKDFRDFNVDYLQTQVDVADAAWKIAIVTEIMAAAGVALAIGLAIADPSKVAGIIAAAVAAVAFADATYALAQSIIGYNDSKDALAAGKVQQTEAIASLAKALAFKDLKLAFVKALDQRGFIR